MDYQLNQLYFKQSLDDKDQIKISDEDYDNSVMSIFKNATHLLTDEWLEPVFDIDFPNKSSVQIYGYSYDGIMHIRQGEDKVFRTNKFNIILFKFSSEGIYIHQNSFSTLDGKRKISTEFISYTEFKGVAPYKQTVNFTLEEKQYEILDSGIRIQVENSNPLKFSIQDASLLNVSIEKFTDLIYNQALELLRKAQIIEEFEQAASLFQEIRGWKDADELYHRCFEDIKDRIYEKALDLLHRALNDEKYGINVFRSCKRPQKDTNELLEILRQKTHRTLTIKKVEFAAASPVKINKGDRAVINIFMYEKSAKGEVDELLHEMATPSRIARSGIHEAPEGALIRIVLSSPDIQIDDGEETMTWHGQYLNFYFSVLVPKDYSADRIQFKAVVYINDVIATRLIFFAGCDVTYQIVDVERYDISKIFASYASQDRKKVAMIIQGMEKARPDIEVFLDVDKLRSGENWEERIYREIDQSEMLYLCWSRNAMKSKYVNKEWRHMYNTKGEEYIEPVPLETPDICPPPIELARKHFNDKWLNYR